MFQTKFSKKLVQWIFIEIVQYILVIDSIRKKFKLYVYLIGPVRIIET